MLAECSEKKERLSVLEPLVVFPLSLESLDSKPGRQELHKSHHFPNV